MHKSDKNFYCRISQILMTPHKEIIKQSYVFSSEGKYGTVVIINYEMSTAASVDLKEGYILISAKVKGRGELTCEYNYDSLKNLEDSSDKKIEINIESCWGKIIFILNENTLKKLCVKLTGYDIVFGDFLAYFSAYDVSTNAIWLNLMAIVSCSGGYKEITAHLQEQAEETILLLLISAYKSKNKKYIISKPLPKRLVRVIKYIEKNPHASLNLQDISCIACCSSRTLQRLFSKEFDKSPMQYLKQFRLKRANVDLKNALAEETVTMIAFRYGFFHLGQFSKDYKNEFGESPSQTLNGTY